ncbi:hypothetical protein [Xaviernesmea oryzae]|nr:hypothetical protein [Xaviernesmea oryzae]SEL16208.1 hypothetical protein SAMN04487976_106117 [Xaviernesmea oryzae]
MIKPLALSLSLLLMPAAADAQYKNYEVTPTGRCGAQGTYGNQNFQIDCSGNSRSGQIGGRRPGVRSERPSSVRRGSTGATQSRCFVDGNGNSFCQ